MAAAGAWSQPLLITVDLAMEIGRRIYGVPGEIASLLVRIARVSPPMQIEHSTCARQERETRKSREI
ncbi:MAG: hypothetical protein ACREF0_20280, partial [Acetobacteraceae bacterium]